MHVKYMRCLLSLLLMFSVQSFANAATDTRMQVMVQAEQHKVEVRWLHTHIQRASGMALPQLWNRIVPLSAQSKIPKKVKAIRFLEKATPTETGLVIRFNRKRVMAYLKANHVPYIAREPVLNLNVQLYNAAGRRMNRSAADLVDYAESVAPFWGYRLSPKGENLVLLWRWEGRNQVSLNISGDVDVDMPYESRHLMAGQALLSLKPWLSEVLLKARDAYAAGAMPVSAVQGPESAGVHAQPDLSAGLLLTVERQASLPEQVLFEDDLRRDPHVRSLILRQVSGGLQQYRLQLKAGDDQWLPQWFRLRGMTLTPAVEGWVAH